MSYTVTMSNQSSQVFETSDGNLVNPNGSWTSGTLGDGWVRSSGLGPINFHDIGDQHIPGDSGETWGVLISYQGEEVVGRYEGGGQLNVTINGFGQAELSGMDLRQVQLPSFIFTLA